MGTTSYSFAGHPVFGRARNKSLVTLVRVPHRSVQQQSDPSCHMKLKGMLLPTYLRMARYSSTCVLRAISKCEFSIIAFLLVTENRLLVGKSKKFNNTKWTNRLSVSTFRLIIHNSHLHCSTYVYTFVPR